ncbi:MAG: YkoF family thiamine/hydroxymethylpyrimidine-binding protein [Pseudothermotoga sp.]|uniref:YkoF family thiamine/hydroxymethylpyrimidine-binding protein n=1 Tax=Pseudothermotoga sp. TaxID=2033661 RepID=UPI0025842B45|nr:YkoF family thiamine/hydroxymethylpyrimidine-binding protein [Pseudothermotoga sp.]MDI6863533.1 YkoF family thiamine/hydroxymethylpyrimidine-binding protein [Pseudothermotoga sp.]
MEKTELSCQMSFYPLGTERIDETVNEVLKIIESSNLKHQISHMSTTLWGKPSQITQLIEKIITSMDQTRFVLQVTISNHCGCTFGGWRDGDIIQNAR